VNYLKIKSYNYEIIKVFSIIIIKSSFVRQMLAVTVASVFRRQCLQEEYRC